VGVGQLGRDGMTLTGRTLRAYKAAAGRVARNPADGVAFAAIRRERLPLLTALRAAAAERERRVAASSLALQWLVVVVGRIF